MNPKRRFKKSLPDEPGSGTGEGGEAKKPSADGEFQKWPARIIHVDMDAFFAAVEQRDRPELKGHPVVVGGNPSGRGVVSAASYEARRFGIRSAMPAYRAKNLCPEAVFLRPDFEKYRNVSNRIMSILRQHTDLVESVSLDEAYLDVTHHRFGITDPALVASIIKQNIRAVTSLTASAGVAPNLFLSKIASDFQKPDGLTVIGPGRVRAFLEDLPVRKIPGCGPVTEKGLQEMGIRTCGELAGAKVSLLIREFGKWGRELYRRAQGFDDRQVEPGGMPKQMSSEETYPRDVTDIDWMKERLRAYAREVCESLREDGLVGRTVTLKVKYHDFEQITRSLTPPKAPAGVEELHRIGCELLAEKTLAGRKPVRLLGLGLSGLEESSGVPADLFG